MNICHSLPEKIRIARSFSKAASSYDQYAHLQRDIADSLLGNIDAGAPLNILDLGSGTGYCAGRLAEMFPDAVITSLDIAEAMLLHARQESTRDFDNDRACERENWVCGDGEVLPFRDHSFDLVVSSLTLQWCQGPAQLFQELFRVMKPQGHALISTLAEQTLAELRSSWASVDDYVHVNSFLPVSTITDVLEITAFSQKHCRNEQKQYFYPSLTALTRELKGIGAHNLNAGQPSGLTGKSKLKKLTAAFERYRIPGQGIPVTYDAVFMHLVK